MKTVMEIIGLAKHVVKSGHGLGRFNLRPDIPLLHKPTNTVVHAHQVVRHDGTPPETVVVREFAMPVPVDCFEVIETESPQEGADS